MCVVEERKVGLGWVGLCLLGFILYLLPRLINL